MSNTKVQSSTSNDGSDGEPANKRQRLGHVNEYIGYSFQKLKMAAECSIPILTQEEATPEYLFREHISKRRPCVINALPSISASGEKLQLDKARLVDVAGEQIVQVERRLNSKETFGQNRSKERQLEMTVSSFCQKLSEKDGDLLYLSTQESSSDDEACGSIPCKQLIQAGLISEKLTWAGDLLLHTCNLWMGKSQRGTSSGLHHDFHDNFYLLLKGSKSFRLFSPDCALNMHTYGEIERVHTNGLISYLGSETRADGTMIVDVSDEEVEDDDIDEDAIILGKGFDYESEEDDDYDGQTFGDGKDDFEEMIRAKDLDTESDISATDQRPNNFSQINLYGRSIPEVTKEFPSFSNQRECVVNLEPGQSLYLPAGWFHEVTSKSTVNDTDHIALNYWYQPPST